MSDPASEPGMEAVISRALTANGISSEHITRSIFEALIEAGMVEWALQTKTYKGGDFDTTYAQNALTYKPFTEEEVKNHSWLDPRSPVPTRVVARVTGKWRQVKE